MRGIVLTLLLALSLVFGPMVGAEAASMAQPAHHQAEHCHDDQGAAKASVPVCHLCVCVACAAQAVSAVVPVGSAVRVVSLMSLTGPAGLHPAPLPRPPLV